MIVEKKDELKGCRAYMIWLPICIVLWVVIIGVVKSCN